MDAQGAGRIAAAILVIAAALAACRAAPDEKTAAAAAPAAAKPSTVEPAPVGETSWQREDRIRTTAAEAVCRSVDSGYAPVLDPLPAAEAKALAGCNALDLYYGLEATPDRAKARKCAIRQLGEDPDSAEARIVLADSYANGEGGAANLRLAVHLACHHVGHPDWDRQILRLDSLRLGGDAGWFDACEVVSTTYMLSLCAVTGAAEEDRQRDAELDELSAGWPAGQRRAFTDLRQALNAYAEARASYETDHSGTYRVLFASAEAQRRRDNFKDLIWRLEEGWRPAGAAADRAAADADLARLLQRLRAAEPKAGTEAVDEWGTVDMAGVDRAQQAFLAYRTAWVAFLRLRRPEATEGVAAYVTRERIHLLKQILDETPADRLDGPYTG